MLLRGHEDGLLVDDGEAAGRHRAHLISRIHQLHCAICERRVQVLANVKNLSLRGIYIGRQSGECLPKMFPRNKIWEKFAMWGTCLQLAEIVCGRHVRRKHCYREPNKKELIPVSCLGDNVNVSLQCTKAKSSDLPETCTWEACFRRTFVAFVSQCKSRFNHHKPST